MKTLSFNPFPSLQQITDINELINFSNTYLKFSGLPIPQPYLDNNRVFGIYFKGELVGGFILGTGTDFRTINCFAKAESHAQLQNQMGDLSNYTELCCFWIDAKYRSKTTINFFTWLSMSYSLKKYGTSRLLFGTCSRGLARLYSATEHSKLIHKDRIKGKQTFVYVAQRKHYVSGIVEIVLHKAKRMLKMPVKRVSMDQLELQSVS